nr:hypothetical protein [Tanacetum cinerariifolium]
VMSSPNHTTSDIEDVFSSNSPNYTPVSPNYSPASPGNTPFESSNNSYGLKYCHQRNEAVNDHPPLLLPYLKHLRWEKVLIRQEARAQISKFQRKQIGNNNKISLARFRISTLELIIEDVQVRHQSDMKRFLDKTHELKNCKGGPPPPGY